MSLRSNPPASTHSVANRELHASKRRLLAHAFSDSALKGQEPYIVDTVRKWLDTIGDLNVYRAGAKEWSRPKDMGVWSSNLTLDALGELCFGKSFQAIEKGSHWASQLLMGSTIFGACIGALPGWPLLLPALRNKWIMTNFGGRR